MHPVSGREANLSADSPCSEKRHNIQQPVECRYYGISKHGPIPGPRYTDDIIRRGQYSNYMINGQHCGWKEEESENCCHCHGRQHSHSKPSTRTSPRQPDCLETLVFAHHRHGRQRSLVFQPALADRIRLLYNIRMDRNLVEASRIRCSSNAYLIPDLTNEGSPSALDLTGLSLPFRKRTGCTLRIDSSPFRAPDGLQGHLPKTQQVKLPVCIRQLE